MKHEAIRERHFRILMEKTGKSFELAPDRFTLDNIFSMDLFKYQEIVESIVVNAKNEMDIEKNVKEIAQKWESIKFVLKKRNVAESDNR